MLTIWEGVTDETIRLEFGPFFGAVASFGIGR
jgi:hypothetical protein